MKEYLIGLKKLDQLKLKMAKELCEDFEKGRLEEDKRSRD
jgi:hypothetical protein